MHWCLGSIKIHRYFLKTFQSIVRKALALPRIFAPTPQTHRRMQAPTHSLPPATPGAPVTCKALQRLFSRLPAPELGEVVLPRKQLPNHLRVTGDNRVVQPALGDALCVKGQATTDVTCSYYKFRIFTDFLYSAKQRPGRQHAGVALSTLKHTYPSKHSPSPKMQSTRKHGESAARNPVKPSQLTSLP